jgi:hypothetical protein
VVAHISHVTAQGFGSHVGTASVAAVSSVSTEGRSDRFGTALLDLVAALTARGGVPLPDQVAASLSPSSGRLAAITSRETVASAAPTAMMAASIAGRDGRAATVTARDEPTAEVG